METTKIEEALDNIDARLGDLLEVELEKREVMKKYLHPEFYETITLRLAAQATVVIKKFFIDLEPTVSEFLCKTAATIAASIAMMSVPRPPSQPEPPAAPAPVRKPDDWIANIQREYLKRRATGQNHHGAIGETATAANVPELIIDSALKIDVGYHKLMEDPGAADLSDQEQQQDESPELAYQTIKDEYDKHIKIGFSKERTISDIAQAFKVTVGDIEKILGFSQEDPESPGAVDLSESGEKTDE